MFLASSSQERASLLRARAEGDQLSNGYPGSVKCRNEDTDARSDSICNSCVGSCRVSREVSAVKVELGQERSKGAEKSSSTRVTLIGGWRVGQATCDNEEKGKIE